MLQCLSILTRNKRKRQLLSLLLEAPKDCHLFKAKTSWVIERNLRPVPRPPDIWLNSLKDQISRTLAHLGTSQDKSTTPVACITNETLHSMDQVLTSVHRQPRLPWVRLNQVSRFQFLIGPLFLRTEGSEIFYKGLTHKPKYLNSEQTQLLWWRSLGRAKGRQGMVSLSDIPARRKAALGWNKGKSIRIRGS